MCQKQLWESGISRKDARQWPASLLKVSLFQSIFHQAFKVSENSSDNHNLTSIVWKKPVFTTFSLFSVQITTENYKLTYESKFAHFIKWGKMCVKFGTIYDQLWASTPRCHINFQLFLTKAC